MRALHQLPVHRHEAVDRYVWVLVGHPGDAVLQPHRSLGADVLVDTGWADGVGRRCGGGGFSSITTCTLSTAAFISCMPRVERIAARLWRIASLSLSTAALPLLALTKTGWEPSFWTTRMRFSVLEMGSRAVMSSLLSLLSLESSSPRVHACRRTCVCRVLLHPQTSQFLGVESRARRR